MYIIILAVIFKKLWYSSTLDMEHITSMCGEKMFDISNGKYAIEYFNTVSKLIDSNNDFKKVLSSNYDYKDSVESINEDLIKLNSKNY